MSKPKGQLLFEDFLNKLGVALGSNSWDNLTACWDAREALELYLNPARDEKGHFVKTAPKAQLASEGESKNAEN